MEAKSNVGFQKLFLYQVMSSQPRHNSGDSATTAGKPFFVYPKITSTSAAEVLVGGRFCGIKPSQDVF